MLVAAAVVRPLDDRGAVGGAAAGGVDQQPSADAPDREAAIPIALHPEQGWTLLCNGVVVFEDTGALLPDGHVVAPHRVR